MGNIVVKNYGYFDENSPQWKERVYANQHQYTSGCPLGIINVGGGAFFPQLPGNVANVWTYDFPVMIYEADLKLDQLFDGDKSVLEAVKAAGDYLVDHGCRAITGNCGYFANFQKEMSDYLDVPVAMSSLLQVNWIKSMLKKDEKVGIICANGPALTPKTLKEVGVEDPSIVAIHGLEMTKEFGPLVRQEAGVLYYNPEKLGEEICQAAKELMAKNKIGAFLIECSDLPPFSHLVARATNLPVFDFSTLHKWMYEGVCRKPFNGFF